MLNTTARWVSLIGLIALLGCAGRTAVSTGTPSTVRVCRTSQLRGSFGRLDAGVGQRYVQLTLTNASREVCSVSGYPRVQLVAGDGSPTPTVVVRTGAGSVHRLTVSSGRRVSSLLHWIGIPLSDESQTGPCETTPARASVMPPGEATALSVDWRFGPVCGHGQIDISPLRPGRPSR